VSHATLEKIIAERQTSPWHDLRDFLRRCAPAKDERRVLAQAGALNALGHHRRSALWEIEAPLHDDLLSGLEAPDAAPLAMMSAHERLESDYATTTLTVGPHPMALLRPQIPKASHAKALNTLPHGRRVTIIGMVICRQRPGTANGHCFISLEDETGIANAFVPSDLFEKRRLTITQEPFLKITGQLQRADGTTTVLAKTITAFRYDETRRVSVKSHDFG
jgi:error-prone DNA polymerase